MPNYGYFGYKISYNALIKKENKILFSKDLKDQWCFAKVFNFFNDQNNQTNFDGIYTIKCLKEFKAYSGNYCTLDKPHIHKILRYMRRVLNVKVSFVDKKDQYEFTFNISGKPVKHKFVLTFSRVFYEYPFSEIAKDALRLRENGKVDDIDFSHKSFLEMYHLCYFTFCEGNGHSLFNYATTDISHKRMNAGFKKGYRTCTSVFDGRTEDLYKHLRSLDYKEENWDEVSVNRFHLYSNNFKILKQIKNEKNLRRRARKVVRKVD